MTSTTPVGLRQGQYISTFREVTLEERHARCPKRGTFALFEHKNFHLAHGRGRSTAARAHRTGTAAMSTFWPFRANGGIFAPRAIRSVW